MVPLGGVAPRRLLPDPAFRRGRAANHRGPLHRRRRSHGQSSRSSTGDSRNRGGASSLPRGRRNGVVSNLQGSHSGVVSNLQGSHSGVSSPPKGNRSNRNGVSSNLSRGSRSGVSSRPRGNNGANSRSGECQLNSHPHSRARARA